MRGEGYSLSDIAAATGNGNGGFGGDFGAWWIIIIIILFGWGRNGFGSDNSGAYPNYVLTSDFSQLSRQISDSTAMTERKLDSITNGLCTLGYDNLVQTNNINGNINNLGMSLQNCCCDVKDLIADSKYEMAKGFCSTNNTIAMSTRDIVDNMNANYRALHDEIVANRLEDKNAQITAQQNEINALRLAASQEKQNNLITQGFANEVDALYNRLSNCPVPTTPVYGRTPIFTCGCNNYNNCGCNNGCGY